MQQRASAVVNVNRRDPGRRFSKLQNAPPSGNRLDDAFAKPRTVAVHPSGECRDDWQPGGDVALDAIQRRSETTSPGRRPERRIPGKWAVGSSAVAARTGDVNDAASGTRADGIEQVTIHRHPGARDLFRALSTDARSVEWVWRQMKHPIGGRLVLPLTGRQQVAHDCGRPGTADPLGGLDRTRQSDHLISARHQKLGQLAADESAGFRDERGCSRTEWHVGSVAPAEPSDQRRWSYDGRTKAVQRY